MKKRIIKIMKGLSAFVLVFILCIENFAAVVSDNDGSAFITKAEFDSLKNNFQTQIDQYNTSIDAKIDGAIAAYLAGIKTTSTEASKILVDNYDDIMWVRNYDVYGRWKKWTSRTEMTSDMTNKWFTPSLTEKRHTFRNVDFQFYSNWSQAWTQITTYLMFRPSEARNGLGIAPTTGWAQADFAGIPVMILRAIKDSEGTYYIQKPFNIYTMGVYAMGTDHRAGVTTGRDAYAWSYGPWLLTGIEVLTKQTGDFLRFKVYADEYHTSGTKRGEGTFIDSLSASNFPFPCAWCDDDHNGGPGRDKFDTQTNPLGTGWSMYSYFAAGVTWHNLSNLSSQSDFLRRMMFGQTNSQQANVGYSTKEGGERQEYDFSKSSSSGTFTGKITGALVQNKWYATGFPSGIVGLDVDATIEVPHWPTEYIRDLSSGRFKYNNKGLKYGEGIPLRVDNQIDGYLQITFDSSVEGILDGAKHSNQNLKIDMRKENFLSTTSNWAQGYKGLVNPDSTSEPLANLANYQYTTTDGKIKLTVPMKRDESLWIRIAPWTADKGYCAKWSNLNMTINAN